MQNSILMKETFEKNNGILRLIPNFVPRRFARPGRRLRLHPNDYFALGIERGAIKERWFSSTVVCMNGPLTAPDEGLSYVAPSDNINDKFLFRDIVELLGADLIGKELYDKYGTWPMFSKFFDYETPLFHHMHLKFEDAARVGRYGKPEAYYFPPEMNNYPGEFPATYFGFDPDVTKEEVRSRIAGYIKGDTRITELSRAYRIELGTGWYTAPGVVHAPGSYLTYEPQWNSDVNSVVENVTSGEVNPYDMLVENCPADKQQDVDYIMSLIDWDKNVDPHYRKNYFCPKLTDQQGDGFIKSWVSYKNEYIAAKELRIDPGCTVTLKETSAFGCVMIQGYGSFGSYDDAEAASTIRFGTLSGDEYFVSKKAAEEGIKITNRSKFEPMVILMHFGPDNVKEV